MEKYQSVISFFLINLFEIGSWTIYFIAGNLLIILSNNAQEIKLTKQNTLGSDGLLRESWKKRIKR